MTRLAFLALIVTSAAACATPEEAVVQAGGKAPILCLRRDEHSGYYFCRDAARTIFVCDRQDDAKCVTIERVRAVLDGVLEVGQ